MEYKSRKEVPSDYKWDLSKMYSSNKEIEDDIKEAEKLTDEIIKFKGHIMDNANTLLEFLRISNKQDRILEKLYTFAHLDHDADTTNDESKRRYMKIQRIFEDINEKYAFIRPEFFKTDYERVLKFIKENKNLDEYKFYLESLYRYKEHSLSAEQEEIFTKACNALGNCDEVFNNINNTDINLGKIVNEDGEEVELTNFNYNSFISSNNREVRKSAFKTLYKYYSSLKNTIAAAFVGAIKESVFVSKVSKFDSTLQSSLFADNIDISVYKNLINTVHNNLGLMYDYMKLKKDILGLDEIHLYDIYVNPSKNERDNITFEEGKKIIFDALKPLGQNYLEDLKKAFDEKWIDVYPSKGKRSGAYSSGCYDSNPYLLLNYNETAEDVNTMIHELGHSMHTYYSKCQNYVNHSYPIFLAEIASTVNEVLLNDYMYKNAKTKNEKIHYLNKLLELIRVTIYRQTMFAEFEMLIHDKEASGIPLTEEEISNTYYELVKLYFGKDVVIDEEIRHEWARVPHFYTPFYVYKYATGLSCALSIVNRILKNDEKTKENYLKFLKSGGSDYPLEILKKVGIDMTSPKPIEEALEIFKEKLNQLKKEVEGEVDV